MKKIAAEMMFIQQILMFCLLKVFFIKKIILHFFKNLSFKILYIYLFSPIFDFHSYWKNKLN
jgi:hypothetical protein